MEMVSQLFVARSCPQRSGNSSTQSGVLERPIPVGASFVLINMTPSTFARVRD
jgi:hypothetical protein